MWVNALLRRVSMDKSGGILLKLRGQEIDVKAPMIRARCLDAD